MMNTENATNRMKVRLENLQNRDSVKITGPFDQLSDIVLEYVREILANGKKELILDLGEVTYMTSQGIACLIKVIKLSQAENCALFVYHASHDMSDLMKLARIDKYVQFI
jgi:anti-anti-sigma factor